MHSSPNTAQAALPLETKRAHPPPLHHLVSRTPEDYRILESKMYKDTSDDIFQTQQVLKTEVPSCWVFILLLALENHLMES